MKKRKIQQISEDESKGVLQKLLKDWILNPLENDFGFDFDVRLTNPVDSKTQEVSEIAFFIQNKSSITSHKEKAIEQLSMDDWVLYLGSKAPVLIKKYDIPNQEFYWEIAQDYLWDVIEKEDPNWKRQKSKAIRLTKKIKDLDEIKKAILISQKRITRYHSLSLGLGEGIKIDRKDLSALEKYRERALDEFKILSLQQCYYQNKAGNKEESIKILRDVYNSPKNDEAKIMAIIGLIFELDITNLVANQQALNLAEEAIQLSERLKNNYLKACSIIIKDRAILFLITKKMTEIQLGLKIQEVVQEQLFTVHYFQELFKLDQMRKDTIKEVNDCLLTLISHKYVHYFLFCLSLLLDSITTQVMVFSVFNKGVIEQEVNSRQQFIEQIEDDLANIRDIDLRKGLLRSLANYYYWTLRQEKAVSLLSEALDLARKDADIEFIKGNDKLLEAIKSKADPYEAAADDHKEIDDLSVEEYQEFTRSLLIHQGINLDAKDSLSSTIGMALRDINPKEYLEFCENLRAGYVSTSVVGKSLGLPSMGLKIVWCKHCKSSIEGFDLKGSFEIFKRENCEQCGFLKGRSKDWKCNVKIVKEQQKEIPMLNKPQGK